MSIDTPWTQRELSDLREHFEEASAKGEKAVAGRAYAFKNAHRFHGMTGSEKKKFCIDVGQKESFCTEIDKMITLTRYLNVHLH